MRRGLATTLAVLMLGTGLVACGGGGGGTTTGADTGATAAPTIAGGGGETPADVLTCIQGAGLQPTLSPGNDAFGITETIHVEVPPNNRIIVDFFTDPAKAAAIKKKMQVFLGYVGGGSSEVVGGTTVLAVARPGAEQELNTVKGCLGS